MDSEAMSTGKNTKLKSTTDVSSDRLTSLPQEMKGKILSCLHIQDAVQTSVLSSAWRDTWTTMPKISLCDVGFGLLEFITLVDMVLSLHQGHLDEFKIIGDKVYIDVFDRWILLLSRKSPSKITIQLVYETMYKIPSRLFSATDLKHLCLLNCIIRLPRGFQGFKKLTELDLERFSSTHSDIEDLISRCPMLTELRLIDFEGIDCLNIQAPELCRLKVDGDFEDIHIYAPNLEEAGLTLRKDEPYQSDPGEHHDGKSYLNQVVGSLRDIKRLLMTCHFLTYLSKGCILTELPAVFDHLKSISLDICFCFEKEVLASLSLFKNAPNVTELCLKSAPWDVDLVPTELWFDDHTCIQEFTLQMDHLVTVHVLGLNGFEYEVALIGKLLTCAPALEEVKIFCHEEPLEDMAVILKKLLALPRVSHRAKVIVA